MVNYRQIFCVYHRKFHEESFAMTWNHGYRHEIQKEDRKFLNHGRGLDVNSLKSSNTTFGYQVESYTLLPERCTYKVRARASVLQFSVYTYVQTSTVMVYIYRNLTQEGSKSRCFHWIFLEQQSEQRLYPSFPPFPSLLYYELSCVSVHKSHV